MSRGTSSGKNLENENWLPLCVEREMDQRKDIHRLMGSGKCFADSSGPGRSNIIILRRKSGEEAHGWNYVSEHKI